MAEKDKIASLNRQRGACKSQFTKLTAFLDDGELKDSFEIEVKLSNLRKTSEKLEDLKIKYFDIVKDDNELDAHLEVFSGLEDEGEKLEVRLKKLLSFCNSKVDSSQSDLNKSHINVNLPEIPLPRFSGNYQDWYNFKEQFLTLIDSNVNLSETQKLYYLKSTLSDSALDVVTSDDSYNSLFQALEQRFQNQRAIVNSHINEILSMEMSFQDTTKVAKGLRTIVDRCQKHIRALKTLGLELNNFSEVMLINIITRKLDKDSQKTYELSLTSTELPKWNDFIEFLQKRCIVLENLQSNLKVVSNKPKLSSNDNNSKMRNLFVKNNSYNDKACIFCKSTNHYSIIKCDLFLKQNESDRYLTAKKYNLCLNCLCSSNHKLSQCLSKTNCRLCGARHNSLLCRKNPISKACNEQTNKKELDAFSNEKKNSANLGNNSNDIATSLCSEICLSNKKEKQVLLSTCIVYLENANGIKIPARAILDSGSEANFLTKHLADLLNLKKNKASVNVSGINGKITNIKSKMQTFISNRNGSFRRPLSFLVTPKITEFVPSRNINLGNIKLPQNIELADPNFDKPTKVDVLIGAELFYEILETHKLKISQLVLQLSKFGYLISGTLENECQQKFCGFIQQNDRLEENLQKFWKLECTENESNPISGEELLCENHFLETHYRNSSGRFVVTMPLKENPSVLGDSKIIAEKRLQQLWNRLDRTPIMRQLYCDFMKDYEKLGHMHKIREDTEKSDCYYLPHHGVYRSENPTTKLRVVFNASNPTTSGKSLNDILLKGQVKEDLYDIMIRFRKHKFVFLADIEKMYRQILINPNQRKLLRILWKSEFNAPLEIYELNTVTYGTSCAPFLAIRVLKQLAVEEAEKYSQASEVLLNDCYMDDIISGEDTLDAAKELQFQLIKLLESSGMHLHKWKANHLSLLENVNNGNIESYTFLENETKALGVAWKPNSDVFTFKVKIDPPERLSKRTILSDIARLFDPLGLIGPVITKAKIYMQELWKLKLDWNDPIPDSLAQSWIQFINFVKSLENLKISRYILNSCSKHIYIQGFADASSVAFGAAVYIQSFSHSQTSCHLISSKSQVAPLKTISIPRLELSACLLLSKLVVRVLKALKLSINEVYLYTDSQIALAWIQTPPWKLKTFVGNRVAKIQGCTQNFHWKHISSNSNPADLISRGLDGKDLINNRLWWHGPDFLSQRTCVPGSNESHLSQEDKSLMFNEMKDSSNSDQLEETMNSTTNRLLNLSVFLSDNEFLANIFSLTHNFMKLIRICSFIFRFINRCKKVEPQTIGPLTNLELKSSESYLIKQVQHSFFVEDLKNLQKQRSLSGNSKLKYFNPFLDSEGIIRVGGRLDNSSLTYNKKHPILLPNNHKLSEAIFEYFHKKFFHVGPQALLHHVRQNYWILNGRSLARKIVHRCVVCFRNKPVEANQIMGILPPERVNPCPTFQNCGIDFCGPFQIKYKYQRKGKYSKIYVALFVCLATKAIHLDFVTDLKSESFIATLKRFFSRRGKSSTIMTDNGSTFVGTNTELKKMHAIVRNPDEMLTNYLTTEAVNWKFIPPRSPNFGGLWEAGVKAFKYHLKRSLGNSRVTLEEFLTIITQIEGILNSRPLLPLSSDPNEIEVLTPGHFLVGRPITSIPEPDITTVSENRLSHWQKIAKLTQLFWKRWQHDYLNQLQQRNKWVIEKNNIKEGCVVILKDENLPPGKWSLGRICKVKYGPDNKARVFEIKTVSGTVTSRGISKICPLPIKDNE